MGLMLLTEKDFGAPAGIAHHGHVITEQRTDPHIYPDPRIAYLIYFRFNPASMSWIIRHATSSIFVDRQTTDERLFDIARSSAVAPEIVDHGFDDLMIWRAPTYLTLVVDHDNFDWAWDRANGVVPITFLSTKLGNNYHDNFSFYNAVETRVRNKPAVQLANYFKLDAAGTNIGPREWRTYCMLFKMMVPVELADAAPKDWDPDSENQGPGGMVPPA
jgi:hypothetical protein